MQEHVQEGNGHLLDMRGFRVTAGVSDGRSSQVLGRALLDEAPTDPRITGRRTQIADFGDREQIGIERRRDPAPVGGSFEQVVGRFVPEEHFYHLIRPLLRGIRPPLPFHLDLGADDGQQCIAEGLGEAPLPEACRQGVRN